MSSLKPTKQTTEKTTEPSADPSSSRSGVRPATRLGTRSVTLIATRPAVVKPSGWKRFWRALARYPRLTTTVFLLALASGTGLVLLYLLFRGAWSQHPDNVPILRSILEMEMAREDTLEINDNPQQVVTRTYLTLEPYVANDGWQWINRFGSTITYGKEDQRLIASCSPYSPVYIICDLSEIP